MFNRKKIIDLQMRVSELEAKVDILADRLSKAYKEIEGIYTFLATSTPAENPVIQPKPKPKYRLKNKNGKENTKANK
jgi:hypothetical protein